MAAKPPKPPGNSLNQSSNNSTVLTTNTSETNNNSLCNNKKSIGDNNVVENTNGKISKPSCSCTNISIMHLFHEMKQEFPTIPDLIVAQCVNENCHQRESCIQKLRKELALNPIPVQTYPAKVLQQQQQQLRQQQKLSVQKPPTALKPIRPAPTAASIVNTALNTNSNLLLNTASSSPPSPTTQLLPTPTSSLKARICDSVDTANNNLTPNNNNNKINNNQLKDVKISNSANENNSVENCSSNNATTTTTAKRSDMPTTTTAQVRAINVVNSETQTNQNCQNDATSFNNLTTTSPTPMQQPARVRPNTLNLQQQQQQQQQRQQLNIQLQQHFQQRNQQQQLQQQQQQQQKPLRKAPLPPIPPKPAQFTTNPNNSPQTIQRSGSTHSQQSSVSNESCLTSPISSAESEISVNVSLSSPTGPAAHQHPQHHHHNNYTSNNQQQPQLKSPIRHRSVINVQPEPPYTRDFLASPTTSSSGGGTTSSHKSFTSVNLTLRQPNSSAPQSTIDISAGPGLSGAGSGLTYSSTSYDARRGYQKNFHITVTDEGGVFSASRIRPRSCYNPGEQELDGLTPDKEGGLSPIHATASEQSALQQQYPNQHHQQQQMVEYNNYEDMCLPRKCDGVYDIIRRQKQRRDKLANALRDNKKRLSQVEQEINVLTEPVSPGESVRLDNDIQRLRCDCEAMLNELECARRCGPSIRNNQAYNSVTCSQDMHQHPQPQPFPRQRPPRPPHATVTRQQQQQQQPQLDFVQHHIGSPSSSTTTTPTTLINSSNCQHEAPPPTYQQYCQQYYQQRQQQQQQQQFQYPELLQPSTDDEDYSDTNTEGGGGVVGGSVHVRVGGVDTEESLEEMWACNMCTFRNHPQLNICECCENVRILPGTIRIVPAVGGGATSAASAC